MSYGMSVLVSTLEAPRGRKAHARRRREIEEPYRRGAEEREGRQQGRSREEHYVAPAKPNERESEQGDGRRDREGNEDRRALRLRQTLIPRTEVRRCVRGRLSADA